MVPFLAGVWVRRPGAGGDEIDRGDCRGDWLFCWGVTGLRHERAGSTGLEDKGIGLAGFVKRCRGKMTTSDLIEVGVFYFAAVVVVSQFTPTGTVARGAGRASSTRPTPEIAVPSMRTYSARHTGAQGIEKAHRPSER